MHEEAGSHAFPSQWFNAAARVNTKSCFNINIRAFEGVTI